jgi:putative zinc finger protein
MPGEGEGRQHLINCADFMAELGNYLEGEVADEVRLQLEHHLSHCQTCTVLVDSTRKTVKIVTEAGAFDLPKTAFRLIMEQVMTRIKEKDK